MRLESYAQGRWVQGTGSATELRNAINGDKVAEVSSAGVDFCGMLDHGRSRGGPALRDLTFHQRAVRLKALAQYLIERKEELYGLSAVAGNSGRFTMEADSLTTATRTITLEDVEHFAELTGDTFYAHMDEEAAKANPFFDGRVAHGYIIVSAAAGLFVEPDPGPVLANYGIDNLQFMQPVYPGDTLKAVLTCKHKTARESGGYGEVRWDTTVTNQDDKVVAQ